MDAELPRNAPMAMSNETWSLPRALMSTFAGKTVKANAFCTSALARSRSF